MNQAGDAGRCGVNRRWTRRELLLRSAMGLGAATVLGPLFVGCKSDASGDDALLSRPDENGLRLPPGARSRVIAISGKPVGTTSHLWHAAPDGGAVFETSDGGWIYVSNSEVGRGKGGVGAIRFAGDGTIVDAYSILSGTSQNCAGGGTPWGKWLSCEEIDSGEVYECDPYAPYSQGIVRPALGVFKHEAAATDPDRQQLYLTEDQVDGLLYRFTPTSYPSLASGQLEALQILDPAGAGEIRPGETRPVAWHLVSDPFARSGPTRQQVQDASPFRGGEGCDYAAGAIFFATKGDDRIWRLDVERNEIEILYDRATASNPILAGVDNVFATPSGDLYIAEDPGSLQIVALRSSGEVQPIVQLTGNLGSEITGPALSPDGQRLYFSSQRMPGKTFEVTGAL